MFLSSKQIEQALANGEMAIEPYDKSNLKSACYTFTLSPKILIPKSCPKLCLDSKPEYDEITIGHEGFLLNPGVFALGFTREKLSLKNKYVCFLNTRASCAQLGLHVLLGSDFAEPNTDNIITLEIHNSANSPIRLEPGMGIVKCAFAPVG